MNSICIPLTKDSNIDCGILCQKIQKLIVGNIQGQAEFDKAILISIQDVTITKEINKRLTYNP